MCYIIMYYVQYFVVMIIPYIMYVDIYIYIYMVIKLWMLNNNMWGRAPDETEEDHPWNRNPRPQPKKCSKLVSLIEFREAYTFLNWLSGALVTYTYLYICIYIYIYIYGAPISSVRGAAAEGQDCESLRHYNILYYTSSMIYIYIYNSIV